MTKKISDLTNKEIEITLNLFKEEINKRKQEEKKMIDKKKIPFPSMKREDIPKPQKMQEEQVVRSEELEEQEEAQYEEYMQKKENNSICRHEISSRAFIRLNGLKVCGHCRKAIFENQNNIGWQSLDEELPKEWFA